MTDFKHFICEKCKRTTSTTNNYVPLCKCSNKIGERMKEIKKEKNE